MPPDHPILAGLNDVQEQVVRSGAENLLVVAGAGSGKTRVLTSRIAWLMAEESVAPYSILAVTFTNKAAREMRERVASLLGGETRGLWIGTFHAISYRLLRMHWEEAELSRNFQILDADDQFRLVRQVARDHELTEGTYPTKFLCSRINDYKESGIRYEEAMEMAENENVEGGENREWQERENKALAVYQGYEEACVRAEVVDFAELMLRSCELLEASESVCNHYRQRFSHVLLDEFQDTNWLQYRWLRLLARKPQRVMAVGDDDQSIYGWRGARAENMSDFREDYAPQLYRLEQNYRSSGNILKAANALIKHNPGRLGKDMWSTADDGGLINLYCTFNQYEEADCVAERIREWRTSGGVYADVAVLYRTRAQSRVLESALLKKQIPYQMYGGVPFYQRAEVKDALAYLRLVANRNDDVAFVRAVGVPARGVGDVTLNKLQTRALEQNSSLWVVAKELCATASLGRSVSASLSEFIKLIDDLESAHAGKTLADLAGHAIEQSGLRAHYEKDTGEVALERLENLDELINACSGYDSDDGDNDDEERSGTDASGDTRRDSALERFLGAVPLDADRVTEDAPGDKVKLMTMHAAKGLEFPMVFIVGMVEGLLPHSRSMQEEEDNLEEERRLCYVGITRARDALCLGTYSHRRVRGMDEGVLESRFLGELPGELLSRVLYGRALRSAEDRLGVGYGLNAARRARGRHTAHTARRPGAAVAQQAVGEYRIGSEVSHDRFGVGTITHLEGADEHARAGVQFRDAGFKWLVLSYARLSLLEQ